MAQKEFPEKVYVSYMKDYWGTFMYASEDKGDEGTETAYLRANLIDDIAWLVDNYIEDKRPQEPHSEAENLLFEIRDKLLNLIDDDDERIS